MFNVITMDIAIENILSQPWSAAFDPYVSLFGGFPEVFYGLFLIAVPTLIVGMKTQKLIPPLMVLIFGSFLVAPFAGQFSMFFMLAAGICFGILFYAIAKGIR